VRNWDWASETSWGVGCDLQRRFLGGIRFGWLEWEGGRKMRERREGNYLYAREKGIFILSYLWILFNHPSSPRNFLLRYLPRW